MKIMSTQLLRAPLRWPLYAQILLALLLAIIIGLIFDADTEVFGASLLSITSYIGSLFLNALKMLIVPLIVSSIIVGMMDLDGDVLGRLGSKTLLYYLATSLFAILTGLLIVNLIQPGLIDGVPARDSIGLAADTSDVLQNVAGRGSSDVAEVFLRMIPSNVIAAAAEGQMLGLIFFSLLFGYFVSRLKDSFAETQKNFWQGLLAVMMQITNLVMKFSPIGVFALVCKVVLVSGVDAFAPLAWFFAAVILALCLHMFVTLSLILKLVARVRPTRHFKAMLPALLTAFSTSSSSATLPITMESVETRARVSNRVAGFTLPLGATVNMDGTALYECVAAMFIAQAYGLQLDLATQFTVVMIALLTSVGVAGIPSASLVAISIILGAIGLPLEAVGLILVVDRVLDMCRTAVNVFSDSCCAVTIARLEGEDGVLGERALEAKSQARSTSN